MSQRGIEGNPVIEKLVEVDQKVISLEAKTQLREARERLSPAEAAESVGLPRDYATAEENVWKRLRFRDRWPELREFDERVAEFELRQAAVADELRELHERARVAPDRDAEAFAEWELQGRQGERPVPSLPTIERDIKRLQDEREGLSRAITRKLDEKASYVERHRKRLTKQAKDGVDEAADRYLKLVDELAAARQELRSRRRDEVIASLYPAPEAMVEPPDTLAGARKKPLELAGINGPVAPDRLFDVLRADVEWLRQACTNEQAAAIAGVDPRHKPGTVWVNDPEERRKRAERMAQWAVTK